jgi:ribosomal protein S1
MEPIASFKVCFSKKKNEGKRKHKIAAFLISLYINFKKDQERMEAGIKQTQGTQLAHRQRQNNVMKWIKKKPKSYRHNKNT